MEFLTLSEFLDANSLEYKLQAQIKAALDANENQDLNETLDGEWLILRYYGNKKPTKGFLKRDPAPFYVKYKSVWWCVYTRRNTQKEAEKYYNDNNKYDRFYTDNWTIANIKDIKEFVK